MKLFEVESADHRISQVSEVAGIVIPTAQKLTRSYKLFGFTIYSKTVDYSDSLSGFDAKQNTNKPGFR